MRVVAPVFAHCRPVVTGALVLVLAAGALPVCLSPTPAHADELSEVRAELATKLDEAEQLADDIRAGQEQVESLQKHMGELLDQIDEKQAECTQLQRHGGDLVKAMYKNSGDLNLWCIFSESQTLSEVFGRMQMRERVIGEYYEVLGQVKQAQQELDTAYAVASSDKDAEDDLVQKMQDKQEELNGVIAELREREALLDVEQQAALAQAAAAARKVAQTFETGTIVGDEGSWTTCMASAYGGASDKMTPNPGITATGTVCDDWSVGVAVPLSWGPSAYYGRRVEVSYGGQSIIAPVVDCGGMDGKTRVLDLQPGVFKAFGCSTCNEWGVREVRYRFI